MKKIFQIFITVIFMYSIQSCSKKTLPPIAGPSPSVTFPSYIENDLKNGIKHFYVNDKRSPTLTLMIRIQLGKYNSPENVAIPMLLASLLDKGTKSKKTEEFNSKLDSVGGSFRAFSSVESISIEASSLSSKSEILLDLVSEVMTQPSFDQIELDKAKQTALSSLMMSKKDPAILLSEMRRAVVFGNSHPYALRATEEKINSVTVEDLNKFHKKYFISGNIMIAVVTDIPSKKSYNLIDTRFSAIPSGSLLTIKLEPEPIYSKPTVYIIDRPSSVQSSISVVSPFVSFRHIHTPKLDILLSVLGGGFSGRLFGNLREKHGWTYGAYSKQEKHMNGGAVYHAADVRTSVTADATREIINEIKKIGENPIPDKELDLHRKYLIGRYLLSLENPKNIATMLLNTSFYDLPISYYSGRVKEYNAVTSNQLKAITKNHLDMRKHAIVIVGNAEEIKKSMAEFGPVEIYNTDLNRVADMPSDLDIDLLIEKTLDAQGKKKTLKEISSLEISGNVSIYVEKNKVANGVFELIRKPSTKSYYSSMDVSGSKQQVYVNKDKVFKVYNNKIDSIEGDLKISYQRSVMINPFLDFNENKDEYNLKGKFREENKLYYVISRKTSETGEVSNYYINDSTFLCTKVVYTVLEDSNLVTYTSNYSDFTSVKVDKNHTIVIPYRQNLVRNLGDTVMLLFSVVNVKINEQVEDKKFLPPTN